MPADAAELARRARDSGRFGIDTEFMGEGRYRPELCLVQIAVPGDDPELGDVTLLDPLADDPFDPAPLADVLADPEIEVVLHAGRQDVALLRRLWGCEIRNVFDTQVAAGFAGMRAQLSYEGLLREIIGVRLRKTASFTRWDRRPLSPEQLDYAREDVLHLLALAAALQERLSEIGRLEWAREECAYLEEISDERDLDTIFGRLPRVNSMDPGQRAVARELVEWREGLAERGNRPVSSVLQDATLVEVAKRRPQTSERLSQIRGLHESTLRRRGDEILAAVSRGRDRDGIPVEGDRPTAPDPADAPLIALAEALVRARANQAGLAYELLAARADLQRIVTAVRAQDGDAQVRTLQGWRREVVGSELLDLLAGRRSLRVGPGLDVLVDG
ncbi:MAG: ribonuclease [Solirubrobacteraceae bacterium]|jgi:ribonuclease D|nr:ribonuclease [Solirubrobacteraceae bacterium]